VRPGLFCRRRGGAVRRAAGSHGPPGPRSGLRRREVAAGARDLAQGVLSQVEAILADPATALPAEARDALAALADALGVQISGGSHLHRVGHAAGAGVASPFGRAGAVRNPA